MISSMGHLAHFAQFFRSQTLFNELLDLAEELWETDDNCQYVSVGDSDLIKRITGGTFIPEVMEIEVVKVTGDLAPHTHRNSDSVVLVKTMMDGVDDAEVYKDVDYQWNVLEDNEVLVIPRGTVHGFRVGSSKEPFYLIVVSNPPIADNDTIYV